MEPSLFAVLWRKLVRFVDGHTAREMRTLALRTLAASALAGAMIDPAATHRITAMHGHAPAKLVCSFALVFNAGRVLRVLHAWCAADEERDESETIEGIPTDALLDHLFTAMTFRRAEIVETFQAKRERVDALGKKLDELRIFIRGEKNSRVLNPEFTREDLAAIFRGRRFASELSIPFRKEGAGLTRRPGALPSSGFASRMLPQT